MGFPKIKKDPNARLDYPYDMGPLLVPGAVIVSATVVVTDSAPDDALVVEPDPDIVGSIIIPWINGGTGGKKYDVTYHWVDSEGREDDRTRTLDVKER